SGRNLQRIYEMMQMVPESHTSGNPTFEKVEQTEGKLTKESLSSYGNGVVKMQAGNVTEDFSDVYDVGKMKSISNDAKKHMNKTKVDYFNWTALHEIAHAVDDKKGFMRANGKAAAHGGWVAIGGDLVKVAEACAEVTGFKTPEAKKYIV